MIKFILIIFSCLTIVLNTKDVNALEYTASQDISYNSTENRLFNLAVNNGLKVQDKFIIFRTDNYNYYAIYSDDVILASNVLTMNKSKVLHYYRTDNYNSSWYLTISDDDSAKIYLNSYSLGNIKNSNYIFNFNDFQDYTYRYYSILLLMLLGILLFFRCFRK